MGIVKLSL